MWMWCIPACTGLTFMVTLTRSVGWVRQICAKPEVAGQEPAVLRLARSGNCPARPRYVPAG